MRYVSIHGSEKSVPIVQVLHALWGQVYKSPPHKTRAGTVICSSRPPPSCAVPRFRVQAQNFYTDCAPPTLATIGAIGLGITVVQVRTILTSLKTRWDNRRKAPETLRAKVDGLERHVDEVERLLEAFPPNHNFLNFQ